MSSRSCFDGSRRVSVPLGATEDLNVLHLPGHDRFVDAFFLEETNHAAKLSDTNPLHALGTAVHLRISLFADRRHDERHTGPARALDDHEGKLAIPRNQSEFHFVTPRSEASMKRSRSVTSGESVISCLIRSTA